MNTPMRPVWILALSMAVTAAAAQETPRAPVIKNSASRSAQDEAGEPRATGPTAGEAGAVQAGAVQAGAVQAGAVPASAVPAGAAQTAKQASAPRASAHGTAANRTPSATGAKGAGASDRLDLGTATVTGDREQPKVMYIVPWKKSDIGDLSGKPMNSLLDEALAPVDREEFKREVVYYNAVNADTPENGASKPAARQGEK